MSRVMIRYVNSFRDRHGRMRYYFRKGGRRFPLPGAPGTGPFSEAYDELLAEHGGEPGYGGKRARRPLAAADGTLAWVIAQYRSDENPEWTTPKESSREIYNRRLDWLIEHYGRAIFGSIEERHVRRIRNQLRAAPSVADATVDWIGRLWRFAKEHIEYFDRPGQRLGPNPATEVAAIHTEHEQHKAWPPELCAAFEQIENPRLIRGYYLLRYTGQRRSDVVQMHRTRFDGSAVEVVQEKTGTYVWIPAHKRLLEHLHATGVGPEYLLSTIRGGPYEPTSLTNMICAACKDLGFPGYSPHGLRHLAGAALAEAGCSLHEIMSILGHLTEKEAAEYVRQAQRKKMASSAMGKWNAST